MNQKISKKEDPDFLRRDLYNHLSAGKEVSYTMFVQILTEKEAENYRFNVLDVTKVIYTSDFPTY